MAAGRRDLKKEARWRRAIREQAGSGMGIRAWCRRHRVKEAAFHWWRRELARRDGEDKTASFVSVHVAEDRAERGDSQIEIVLTDGRCARVTGPVNQQMLTEVLDVLERRAC